MNGMKRLAVFLIVVSVAMGSAGAVVCSEVMIAELDNARRTATLTFAATEKAMSVYFACGRKDYGDKLSMWPTEDVHKLGEVDLGATTAAVNLPEVWMVSAFYGRFFLGDVEPYPVECVYDYVKTQRSGSAGTFVLSEFAPDWNAWIQMDIGFIRNMYSQNMAFYCSRTNTDDQVRMDLSIQNRCPHLDYYNVSLGANFSKPGNNDSNIDSKHLIWTTWRNNLKIYRVDTQTQIADNRLTAAVTNPPPFVSAPLTFFMHGDPSVTPSSMPSEYNVYSVRICDGEGGLPLLNFVPAKQDGTVGLYDAVRERFFASGNATYPFLAGTEQAEIPSGYLTRAVSSVVSGHLNMAGTGGEIFMATDGSGDIVHVFKGAGEYVFTAPPVDAEVRFMIVGGGGAGGYMTTDGGGGGGGGGALTNGVGTLVTIPAGEACRVVVGAGGVPQTANLPAGCGGDSSITIAGVDYVGRGGGAGGCYNYVGLDGGNSGGGGSGSKSPGAATQLAMDGLTLIGFSGNAGHARGGGGGGGAGEAGYNLSTDGYAGGRGGDGMRCDITGEVVCYGGGGGGGMNGTYSWGGGNTHANAGGRGGGGIGGSSSSWANAPGADDFGGGGGGGSAKGKLGGRGGSGIVILRYRPVEDVFATSAKLTESLVGALRFTISLISLGAVGEDATLEVAYGADAEHLGDYTVLQSDWTVGDYEYRKSVTPGTYCFSFRITNNETSEVKTLELAVSTKGLPGEGGELVELADGSVIHTYTNVGTNEFVVPEGGADIRYLLVGGGGSGGGHSAAADTISGGGGGGGGVLTNDNEHILHVDKGTRVRIVVGAGGASVANSMVGNDGGNSMIIVGEDGSTTEYVAYGGGGGGFYGAGRDGGNGGGGSAGKAGGAALQTGWNAEGDWVSVGYPGCVGAGCAASGGGGAGGTPTKDADPYAGGAGGPGAWSDITGTLVCYGGGGGAGDGGYYARNPGGAGGGGCGGRYKDNILNVYLPAGNGTDGLGGGGGGGYSTRSAAVAAEALSGRGGNGIVIIRYMPLPVVPDEPVGKLAGIELKDVKVKGEATNVVEEVAYKVEWAGKGESVADVSLVYGASPDALTGEKEIAQQVIGSGAAVVALPQSAKGERMYYVELKITSDAGTFFTEPVQVLLPKRINSGVSVMIK